jgi:hypothetical protein
MQADDAANRTGKSHCDTPEAARKSPDPGARLGETHL